MTPASSCSNTQKSLVRVWNETAKNVFKKSSASFFFFFFFSPPRVRIRALLTLSSHTVLERFHFPHFTLYWVTLYCSLEVNRKAIALLSLGGKRTPPKKQNNRYEQTVMERGGGVYFRHAVFNLATLVPKVMWELQSSFLQPSQALFSPHMEVYLHGATQLHGRWIHTRQTCKTPSRRPWLFFFFQNNYSL